LEVGFYSFFLLPRAEILAGWKEKCLLGVNNCGKEKR
jgi:hypothetical protein